MRSILDPEFKYTPAHETDIRKTFAKARREQEQKEKAQDKFEKIQPIKRAK